MHADHSVTRPPGLNHKARPTAWKFALLAGFITQLLLIVFVTAISLTQLRSTTDQLNRMIDVHMRKQTLTKTMVFNARDRTLIILALSKITDSREREKMLARFSEDGLNFGLARQEFLALPLNDLERQLIAEQGELTSRGQPVQLQVIDLINADFIEEAEELVLRHAIPIQSSVVAALSKLDTEAQRVALEASQKRHHELKIARIWMISLSGAALLLGMIVATIVFLYTKRIVREREQLATQDGLTALPNRMLLTERLGQSLIHAKRNNTLVGVMFIDLDRFKRINDTLGHSSGDQLIVEVAKRLRNAARKEDIVSRLGGDEFVVVIGNVVMINDIIRVIEKILDVASAPYQIAGHELFCSCSIGVSVYPDDGQDISSLLMHADTAMYHAKNSGRNRFQLYNPDMNALAEERLQLETALHYALARDEFIFHYQPQVNLETGRTQGIEALLRWNHPGKGLLKPAEFLEILEETGEIVSVGKKLMALACMQAARWHDVGFTELDLAINVSGKEFWNESLITNVASALEHSGLPPKHLQLELTEGILMGDIDAAIQRVLELKALGVSIAIDDFGTGYSSLAHLKRFPLNAIKIDRYFIKDLEHAPVNMALINSILALSQGLHFDTIAEGVENQAQLDSLQTLGCPIVQGYWFSEPVPEHQVLELLQRDWGQILNPGNASNPSI